MILNQFGKNIDAHGGPYKIGDVVHSGQWPFKFTRHLQKLVNMNGDYLVPSVMTGDTVTVIRPDNDFGVDLTP